jgi:hypothetical protein
MTSRWTMWVDATTEKKALLLLNRLAAEMERESIDASIRLNEKTGGYEVRFAVPLQHASWNDAVVELIDLGQRVGYEWELRGSILDDAEAASGRPRISGVQAIQWNLRK